MNNFWLWIIAVSTWATLMILMYELQPVLKALEAGWVPR